jgi:hypothetical protein
VSQESETHKHLDDYFWNSVRSRRNWIQSSVMNESVSLDDSSLCFNVEIVFDTSVRIERGELDTRGIRGEFRFERAIFEDSAGFFNRIQESSERWRIPKRFLS